MEHFFLLLIFAGTACALSIVNDPKCDETLTGFPCYPSPGETVYIKLMSNATGYIVLFYKALSGTNLNIFVVKNGTVKIRESYRSRTEFSIETGTLKLTDVKEDDAGEYGFKVYTPFGMLVRSIVFTLNIKGRNHSIYINVPTVMAVVIWILLCWVIWKLRLCRKTGYETLN